MIKEIKFTENALKQIKHLLSSKEKGSFFRIAIKGGGCSGFQYDFSFDKSQNEDDLRHENILIDKTSAEVLSMSIFSCLKSSSFCDLSKEKSYWKPEQPPPLIAILKKEPFSFEDRRCFICFKAFSVNLISLIMI